MFTVFCHLDTVTYYTHFYVFPFCLCFCTVFFSFCLLGACENSLWLKVPQSKYDPYTHYVHYACLTWAVWSDTACYGAPPYLQGSRQRSISQVEGSTWCQDRWRHWCLPTLLGSHWPCCISVQRTWMKETMQSTINHRFIWMYLHWVGEKGKMASSPATEQHLLPFVICSFSCCGHAATQHHFSNMPSLLNSNKSKCRMHMHAQQSSLKLIMWTWGQIITHCQSIGKNTARLADVDQNS